MRKPIIEDVEQLTVYINSLVDENAPIQTNEKKTLEAEKEWLEKKLKSIEEGKSHYLVGEVNGRIVSVTNLSRSWGRDSHVASLGVSVRKEYRRLGIATAMMERIIEVGKMDDNIKIITLEVLESNEGARKLYEKLGFKEVARMPKRSKYDGEYVDKVVMDLVE